MTYITDTVTATQDQALAFARQSQEVAAKAFETWAESVKGLIPERVAVPGSDLLPAPTQLIDSAFSFAEGVLATQREFAHRVAETTERLLGVDEAQPAA